MEPCHLGSWTEAGTGKLDRQFVFYLIAGWSCVTKTIDEVGQAIIV